MVIVLETLVFMTAVLLVLVGGVWWSMKTYAWMRQPLYTRPLTTEEQWAETAVEANVNEEEWASILAWADRMDATLPLEPQED